jgi:SAM-dependent methyltransferase
MLIEATWQDRGELSERPPTSHERLSGLPWDASYRDGPAPWDVGRPQPAIVRVASDGEFAGAVLDVGCGTGENALDVAALGSPVLGVDVAETALVHGADSARVLESHKYIEITTTKCDGHYVHVRYRMNNGNLGQFTDNDGCGPNRAYRNMPAGITIVRFQLCEDADGCSAIRPA